MDFADPNSPQADFSTIVAPVYISPKISLETGNLEIKATQDINAGETLAIEHTYSNFVYQLMWLIYQTPNFVQVPI